MRTETFQSILNGVAKRLGMVPSRDLTPATAEKLTEYVNDRLKEGWKFDFWPEWTVAEKRYLRETYAAANNVVAPVPGLSSDERYFIAGQACYQALRAQAPAAQAPATLTGGVYVENSAYWALCADSYSGNDWATGTAYAVGDKARNPADDVMYQCHTAHTAGATFDASKFGALKSFDRFIAYEQTQAGVALTPMDEVKMVTQRNPRVSSSNPLKVAWEPSNNGIQLAPGSPQVVWVTFRLRPPVFTSTVYASGTTYAAGALVYYPTSGECYLAKGTTLGNAPTNAVYWTKVDFPSVLASWVKRAAFADGLKDQKQTDRAAEELTEALEELQEAASRALDQQGQFERAAVQTYGS